MRVVVLFNEPAEDSSIDARDILVQLEAVIGALRELGHEALPIPCTLDLAAVRQALAAKAPDVVFNLVESLGGTDRLMILATALLDALGLPYTGARTGAVFHSANKLAAKRKLWEHGLPTAGWLDSRQLSPSAIFPGRFIIKAVHEHASVAIDDSAIVWAPDAADLRTRLRQRQEITGRESFAEQFIDGREFNLSLVAGPDGPLVLPPAEIDFSTFPEDKPRIVSWAAKWDAAAFEYANTPRRFTFPVSDAPLLEGLRQLAAQCWDLFELNGYARVDFRVDAPGQPWILEINANPCLSPDAGFAAALQQAGRTFTEAIGRILFDALDRGIGFQPVRQ